LWQVYLAGASNGVGVDWVQASRMTLVGAERGRVLEIICTGIETLPRVLRRLRPFAV